MKKWVLDDKFVHIEKGVSVDSGKPVLFVSSNAFEEHLPLEWRAQIAQSDTVAVDQLVRSVAKWAQSNGYQEVPL